MPIFSVIIEIQSVIPWLNLNLQKLMDGKWIPCPKQIEDNKKGFILNYLEKHLTEWGQGH